MNFDRSTTKIHEDATTTARLSELGLTQEWLVRAVLSAELERRSCSSLEPANAPGFKAWAAGFRTIAEELVPRGWAKVERWGLPRLVNAETGVAVAVIHGDDGTGLPTREPKSRNPRGEQSVLLVRSNQKQLNLPFDDERFVPLPPEEEQINWWLLIYSDGDATVRAELSLPIGLGDDQRLSRWEERIILTVPEPDAAVLADEDDDLTDIEVTVRPRS